MSAFNLRPPIMPDRLRKDTNGVSQFPAYDSVDMADTFSIAPEDGEWPVTLCLFSPQHISVNDICHDV